MAESSTGKRIAKNTIMLYFRQILIMLVSLYTVRVVLDVLGVVDYGIYNVVAGVVTMFSFLSGAMATASQRYFSFDIGRKDFEQLKKTFSVSFISYIVVAAVIVLLAETIGLWFLHTKLVLPPERVQAARLIYQASVFSLVCTILTTPFMAAIIAHEDMKIYAYVSILETILKLAIVLILPLFAVDKLIMYGFLLSAVVFVNTAVYRFISRKKYEECRSGWYWDFRLFKELLSYTGWNVFGASVGVFKFQAVNVLLNQFFSPVVIAARSIASQVNSAVSSFAQNFSTAVRPQIIKSYAAGDVEGMTKLVYQSCKGTFFLMYLFTLPLCLEMPFVLTLWLKNPPQYAVLFTQLALIDALIDSVSYPLMTAAQATGKIKLYQGIVGSVLLLNLPFSFLALFLGFSPVSVFVVAISLTFIAFIVRMLILGKLLTFPFLKFIKQVFAPLVLSSIIAFCFPFVFSLFVKAGFLRLLFTTALSICTFSVVFFLLALQKDEKKMITTIIKSKIRSICWK